MQAPVKAPKSGSINWHIITSNLVITVIGVLGFFQPGVPSKSTLATAVVPSVAAGAIAVLTAIFSHSPAATLTQIQSAATAVASSSNSPEVKAALTSLSTALTTLNTNLASQSAVPPTTTTGG